MKAQIDFVSSKLRNVSFMIFKISNILNTTRLKILYYSLFYQHLYYCSELWSNTYYNNVKSLVVLQEKVVRTISHNDSNVPSNNIFYSLNIIENSTLSYKAFNNKLSCIINMLFQTTDSLK